MTGFEAPVEPPRCRVLGICSPAPSLGVTAACPALGEALSGPGYAASGAAQLVCVGRWLGTRRGHSTTSLVPSRPQRLALPTRAVQPARYPRKRACVHVYVPALSVVVSPGRAGTTRGSTSLCPDDGAPEMPSWDLGKCSIRRLPELSVGRLDTGDAPGDAVGRLDPCCYSQEAAETSGRGGQTPNTRRGRGPAHHTVPRATLTAPTTPAQVFPGVEEPMDPPSLSRLHSSHGKEPRYFQISGSEDLCEPSDAGAGRRSLTAACTVPPASLQAKLDQPMPCLPGTPISHSSSGPGASGHSRPELVTSPGLRMDVFGCAEALQPCFCEK
uniref:Uncharacterized protein n=1 Tax=Rangifer tarandus platyrhynchus TaxID=3082113 RepID=A0ACB0FGQ1_RANTA|nr:unnamed protein product [Rangifer tarandus platyrhynchus]